GGFSPCWDWADLDRRDACPTCALLLGALARIRRGNLIRRQERIHRAGAEALKIERDKLKAQRLEDPRELCRHFRSQNAVHFFAGDLDANDLSMMAHAELAEAEPAKIVFALLDC